MSFECTKWVHEKHCNLRVCVNVAFCCIVGDNEGGDLMTLYAVTKIGDSISVCQIIKQVEKELANLFCCFMAVKYCKDIQFLVLLICWNTAYRSWENINMN